MGATDVQINIKPEEALVMIERFSESTPMKPEKVSIDPSSVWDKNQINSYNSAIVGAK
jgi:hypothetical protein